MTLMHIFSVTASTFSFLFSFFSCFFLSLQNTCMSCINYNFKTLLKMPKSWHRQSDGLYKAKTNVNYMFILCLNKYRGYTKCAIRYFTYNYMQNIFVLFLCPH